MASADFSSPLREELSPGKVQNLSPRAAWLYRMRLDDLWELLFSASFPPTPGLTASSCSCGQGFASRFFWPRLATTPCGLATVAVIGSDWLLSSNEILPMLGTRCRRASARRVMQKLQRPEEGPPLPYGRGSEVGGGAVPALRCL
jgi:hypothetical protein